MSFRECTSKYLGVYTKRTHDGRARNRAPEHSSFDCDWPAPVVSMLKKTPLKPLVEDIEKQPRG